jgi:hypothetical protein
MEAADGKRETVTEAKEVARNNSYLYIKMIQFLGNLEKTLTRVVQYSKCAFKVPGVMMLFQVCLQNGILMRGVTT